MPPLDLTGVYEVHGDRLMIQWSSGGRRHREFLPRGTTKTDAIKARRARQADADAGRPGPVAKAAVTYATLMEARRDALVADHKMVPGHPALDAFFRSYKAAEIDAAALRRYVAARQAAGAANSTIRNELAHLRAGFRLALGELVTAVPRFNMPEVENVRQSFFTADELARLLAALPEYLRGPVEFAWLTGWRAANVFGLQWECVDLRAGVCRVPIGGTKSGEPLRCPFTATSALARLLADRERVADGPWVFHKAGRRITKYDAEWRAAVESIGAAGWGTQFDPATREQRPVRKHFHDLRHSFCQNATAAGMPDSAIMALGGWRTASMLARYRAYNDEMLRAAAARLDAFNEAARAAAAREATDVLPIHATRTVDLKDEVTRFSSCFARPGRRGRAGRASGRSSGTGGTPAARRAPPGAAARSI